MTGTNGNGNGNGNGAQVGTARVKQGLAQMLKGGVIVSDVCVELFCVESRSEVWAFIPWNSVRNSRTQWTGKNEVEEWQGEDVL